MKMSKFLIVTVATLGAAGWGMAANADHPSRVNLLNWDGRGVPTGMFPGQ